MFNNDMLLERIRRLMARLNAISLRYQALTILNKEYNVIYIMYKDVRIKNKQIDNNIAFDCMKQYSSCSIRYNIDNLINKFTAILYIAPELKQEAFDITEDEMQEAFEKSFSIKSVIYLDIINSLNILYKSTNDSNKTEIDHTIADIKSKLAKSPKFIQFIIEYLHFGNIKLNIMLVVNNDDSIRIISSIYSLGEVNAKFRVVRAVKTDNINKIQNKNLGFKQANDPFMKYYDYVLAISENIEISNIRTESKFIAINKPKVKAS